MFPRCAMYHRAPRDRPLRRTGNIWLVALETAIGPELPDPNPRMRRLACILRSKRRAHSIRAMHLARIMHRP
jgi:hypothetical protein